MARNVFPLFGPSVPVMSMAFGFLAASSLYLPLSVCSPTVTVYLPSLRTIFIVLSASSGNFWPASSADAGTQVPSIPFASSSSSAPRVAGARNTIMHAGRMNARFTVSLQGEGGVLRPWPSYGSVRGVRIVRSCGARESTKPGTTGSGLRVAPVMGGGRSEIAAAAEISPASTQVAAPVASASASGVAATVIASGPGVAAVVSGSGFLTTTVAAGIASERRRRRAAEQVVVKPHAGHRTEEA